MIAVEIENDGKDRCSHNKKSRYCYSWVAAVAARYWAAAIENWYSADGSDWRSRTCNLPAK